jgi:hypothetical protein
MQMTDVLRKDNTKLRRPIYSRVLKLTILKLATHLRTTTQKTVCITAGAKAHLLDLDEIPVYDPNDKM